VAEPPVPVAALGDVDFLPGQANPLGEVLLVGPAAEMFARLVQSIPRGIVLFMSDPDGEVVMNPAAGEQPRYRVPRRILLQVFTQSDRTNFRDSCAALVQGA